jgi:hypothetical protein
MSAPPPPPPHTPPPLHYPGHGGRVAHRLRPVVIAAIIGVVLLIAAAVTAAIVWTGTANRPKPPQIMPSSHAAMAAPAQPGMLRPPKPPEQVMHTLTTGRSMAVTLTSANPITIGQGVSITPAPGWTLANQGTNWVMLYNADSTAQTYVTVGKASGTDILAELQADINSLTSASSAGLSNVQMEKPLTNTLQGNNFQQDAIIGYTADQSTQQGTTSIVGVFAELLNPSNQQSAFIDMKAVSPAAANQAGTDTGRMMGSML